MFRRSLEQPEALRKTISPRLRDGRVVLDILTRPRLCPKQEEKIFIVGCGSAYHVGVVAKYNLEKTARIPVEAVLASEFRYATPLVDKQTLVICISQSGTTADTIAAMREARRLGAKVLSIVNVVGSVIAVESDWCLYTWAGTEIAVATTKAYSTQLGRHRTSSRWFWPIFLGTISKDDYNAIVEGLVPCRRSWRRSSPARNISSTWRPSISTRTTSSSSGETSTTR
jgi:glucosamine--fructose-6-phosphate aminotransferase (isomerizing)